MGLRAAPGTLFALIDPVAFAIALAALLVLSGVLYVTIASDLPDLSAAKTKIDVNPPGLPPTVTLGTYLRIGLKSLPFGFCPPLRPNDEKTGFSLPDLEIRAPLHVDIDFLRTYLKAVDSVLEPSVRLNLEKEGKSWIADKKSLPTRVPAFFPAVVTSALFIILFSHPQCPVGMAGAVNTVNRFEWLDPSVLTSYEAFCKVKWQLVATMGGHMQRKKRGAEFPVVIEMLDGAGKPVFRTTWSFLKLMPSNTQPRFDADNAPREQRLQVDDVPATSITLCPTSRSPRLFSTSSGDYNPIHLSSLSARAFGMPSAIAHGNLMVASLVRSLEVLEPDQPIHKILTGATPFHCETAFRSIMPVNKQFKVHADQNGRFLIVRGDRVCTEGSVKHL